MGLLSVERAQMKRDDLPTKYPKTVSHHMLVSYNVNSVLNNKLQSFRRGK